jgi:dolichol kinase
MERAGRLTGLACLVVLISIVINSGTADALMLMPGHCGTNCHFYMHDLGRLQLAAIPFFYIITFGLGLLVTKCDWPVGYTRKLLALFLFFTPYMLSHYLSSGLDPSSTKLILLSIGISYVFFLACIATLSTPFRSRSRFLRTAFAAIDRPEDRPHTIAWLVSSTVAMFLMIAAWLLVLPKQTHLYLPLALFISGVGDALAEPVGLRFGRHKYAVRALGTDQRYTRSLEGSACVFLSALFVALNAQYMGPKDWWMGVLLFPTVATLAEAKSPHTWDQPFIIGSCGLTAWFIVWANGVT